MYWPVVGFQSWVSLSLPPMAMTLPLPDIETLVTCARWPPGIVAGLGGGALVGGTVGGTGVAVGGMGVALGGTAVGGIGVGGGGPGVPMGGVWRGCAPDRRGVAG